MPYRERRTALARDVDVQSSRCRTVEMSMDSRFFGNPCMMASCKDAAQARLLEPQQGAVTARVDCLLWVPVWTPNVLHLVAVLRSLAAIAVVANRSLAPIALRRRLAPIALRGRVAPMDLRRKLGRRCLPSATAHHHAAFLCRRFSYALLHLFRRRRRGATLATALLGRRPAYPGCVLLGTHAVAASPIP